MPTARRRLGGLYILAVSLLVSSAGAQAPASVPAPALRTRWAAEVSPDHVLPEYPRPQLVRERWVNLNGRWDYAIGDSGAGSVGGVKYDGTILVPYPVESQLSGVRRQVTEHQWLWYHRTFATPRLAKGERLLLHFGAVDWEAAVFVNGRAVGTHRGGYDPFTLDITDALRGNGSGGATQDLVVRVWDPTDRGPQPRGKQVQNPGSIFYTAVTGIWQTVWLEPVPQAYIAGLTIVPDVDAGTATVRLETGGDTVPGARWRVIARAGNRVAAQVEGPAGQSLVLRLPKARLWSPTDPYLYDLQVWLGMHDSVTSYLGMRKIAVARDTAGRPRLYLNNRPLFQFGPLDQGWWPEGLYTAPTDAALRWDIETTKRLGFNMIRKHVKVEPARWYYHADRLGMLVWQDMPSGDLNTAAAKVQFEQELHGVVAALRHHPSIVMWVPFNEGWGQHDTERYTTWLKTYDPTRLVNNASGWNDARVGDVADTHVYPGPGVPLPDSVRAPVLGEFGGLGLPIAGHTWTAENNWGYQSFTTTAEVDSAYRNLIRQLRFLVADGLAGAVYTQTTDVEVEVNGLMTYDRAVVKVGPAAIAANKSLYGALAPLRAVAPTSLAAGQRWRYTMTWPGSAWADPGYDDSRWQTGDGGFGDPEPAPRGSMPTATRTIWETDSLWLRRTFQVPSTGLRHPHWQIYRAADVDVYLNGQHVGTFEGTTSGYKTIPLSPAALSALRPGANTLAARVRHGDDWQFVDLGIVDAPDTDAKGSTP